VLRPADQRRRQGGAVDVGIVGQHPGWRHAERGVLGQREGVVRRDGRIVHRRHGQGDGGDVGVGLAVVGDIAEAVGAEVVGVRDVREPAIGPRFSVPCCGPLTSAAVRVALSMSESLASTPDGSTLSGVSSASVKASSVATGASFTGVTVRVTVATLESAWPSLAR
jgi:hypothetical protein